MLFGSCWICSCMWNIVIFPRPPKVLPKVNHYCLLNEPIYWFYLTFKRWRQFNNKFEGRNCYYHHQEQNVPPPRDRTHHILLVRGGAIFNELPPTRTTRIDYRNGARSQLPAAAEILYCLHYNVSSTQSHSVINSTSMN